jgi:hypothetical protein
MSVPVDCDRLSDEELLESANYKLELFSRLRERFKKINLNYLQKSSRIFLSHDSLKEFLKLCLLCPHIIFYETYPFDWVKGRAYSVIDRYRWDRDFRRLFSKAVKEALKELASPIHATEYFEIDQKIQKRIRMGMSKTKAI